MDDKLAQLLDETNGRLSKDWKFEYDSDTGDFKLLRLDVIQTDEGTENEWVATIHVMEDFWDFIDSEAG